MSCDHLVCAICAGPVVEGRCGTCRAARADLHGAPFGLTPQVLVLLVALLTALSVLGAHLR
jgi:hypothetical protein